MGKKHSVESAHKSIEKQKTVSHEFFTFNTFQPTQHQVLQAAYMANPSLIIGFCHKGLDLNMNLNREGWKIIHVACLTGNKDLTRFLITKKADLNAVEFSQNWTPLIVAVFNNHLEIVQLLLSEKVDRAKVDKDGMTALAYALEYNNTKIFNVLSSKNLSYML